MTAIDSPCISSKSGRGKMQVKSIEWVFLATLGHHYISVSLTSLNQDCISTFTHFTEFRISRFIFTSLHFQCPVCWIVIARVPWTFRLHLGSVLTQKACEGSLGADLRQRGRGGRCAALCGALWPVTGLARNDFLGAQLVVDGHIEE